MFLVSFLLVRAAHGQSAQGEDTRTTHARELFRRGVELARQERWGDALAAFEQSALLLPHGATFYDVGYCERALGHPARSHKALALALSRSDLPADMRTLAERYLAEAEGKVARLTLTAAPVGATVTIDGRPLERTLASGRAVALAGTREPGPGELIGAGELEVWLDPGSHAVVITLAAGGARVETVRLAAAGRASLALAPDNTSASVSEVRTEPALDRRRRTVALALGGAGAVALVAGGWLALRASSRWSDAKDACPQRSTCPDDRGADLSAGAHRDANLATAALVVGASALAGASILWLSSSDGPRVSVATSPGRLGVTVGGSL